MTWGSDNNRTLNFRDDNRESDFERNVSIRYVTYGVFECISGIAIQVSGIRHSHHHQYFIT